MADGLLSFLLRSFGLFGRATLGIGNVVDGPTDRLAIGIGLLLDLVRALVVVAMDADGRLLAESLQLLHV